MGIPQEYIDDLYDLFVQIDNAEDCKNFLSDLCTYTEIEQMAQRAHAAKLLLSGRKYADVIDETKISSATLSRISRCISHGAGGYSKFIKSGEGNGNK